MINPAQFDRTTLSAVKPGVDATLCEFSTQLDLFLDNPVAGKAALMRAQSELHKLLGVFKMIHLDGLAVYCTEFETVLNELAVAPQMTSALHRDELRDALMEMTRYLDDIAQGADNTTLRLFEHYQQMQQLRGLEMSFELDLFYPNLAVVLPSTVLNQTQFPDPAAYFKAARGYYQQGLLKYLRQEDTPAALKLMQQAVNVAMTAMPANDSRAFWWICSGLIDCVSREGLPLDLSPQKVFGRIDQQMRSMIAGTPANAHPLMNEMLYLIGKSHNVSEIVASIKLTYALDRYFPELTTLSPAELAKRLGVIRELLRSTEEQWELCVQDDEASCANFMTQAKLIAQQCEELDLNSLQYLAQQIAKFAATLSNAENIQRLSMDMAIALLLMGSGISHYRELDRNFQEQVRLLSDRMQSELDDESLAENQLQELVSLYCQTERNDALFLLSKEMLINLEQTEGGLNGFFSEFSKRDEMDNVLRWLKQVQGGLQVSSLNHAAKLLHSIQATLQIFSEKDAAVHPVDSRIVASAISQLEGYLEQLPNGHEDQIDGLMNAITDLDKLLRPEPVATAPQLLEIPEDKKPEVAQEVRSSEDQELLEIFIEEATEVLEIMRANHEISTLDPNNREALVTIRRGFHTLKGSGRMVGLVEIGEVAWSAESAMNKWLQDSKPATPELLKFIEQAVQHFASWVDSLGARGFANIQAEGLVKLAQRIEAIALGGESVADKTAEHQTKPIVPVVDVQPISTPEPVKVEASEADTIHIGDRVLSSTLFRIGSEEAKQHAAALRTCFNDLKKTPSLLIQYDFMRAAHTLAGVNRAMGFSAIVDLAFALESWLQARIEQPSALREFEKPLLDNVIGTLEEMTQRLCHEEMPVARDDLVSQLRQTKEILSAAITPTVTGPVSIAFVPAEEAESQEAGAIFADFQSQDATSTVSTLSLEEVPKSAESVRSTLELAPIELVAAVEEVIEPVAAESIDIFTAVANTTLAPAQGLAFATEVAAITYEEDAPFSVGQANQPTVDMTMLFDPSPVTQVSPPSIVVEDAPAQGMDAFAGFFEQAPSTEEVSIAAEPTDTAPSIDMAAMFDVTTPAAPAEAEAEISQAQEVDAFAGFFEQAPSTEEVSIAAEPTDTAPSIDMAAMFDITTPAAPAEAEAEISQAQEVDAFAGFFEQAPSTEEVSIAAEPTDTAPSIDMAVMFDITTPAAPAETEAEIVPAQEVDVFAGFFDQAPPVARSSVPAVSGSIDDLVVHQEPAHKVLDVQESLSTLVAPLVDRTTKPGQLNIGGRELSKVLFDVGSDETQLNALVLRRCFNDLKANSTQVVQHDFMRAAHTIVGVNRAMGFLTIVNLAQALEGWLQTRLVPASVLLETEKPVLEQVISALELMTQQLCNQEYPAGRDDLVAELRLVRRIVDADHVEVAVNYVGMPENTSAASTGTIPASATDTQLFVAEAEHNPELTTLNLADEFVASAPEFATSDNVAMFEALFSPAINKTELLSEVAKQDIDKLFEAIAVEQPAQQSLVTPAPAVMAAAQQLTAATQVDQAVGDKTDISQVRDDVDEQLLPVFLEEADELMPKVSESLRAWRESPSNEQQANLLKRLLHTMKGSSRMAGAMRIGELAHEMESRVLAVAKLSHRDGYWDGIEHELDRVSGLVEELRTGTPSPLEVVTTKNKEEVSEENRTETEDVAVQMSEQQNRRATERVVWGNMLRVRADVVDRLVNEAGEISVTRSRMETELRVFKESLMELTGSVTRLRQQLREVEIQAESQMQARITLSQEDNEHFDPLEFDRFTRLQELTRFMNESVHDVQTVQQTLLKNLDETAGAMSAQARINRDLQQRLMSVRMVPFNSISERLYRIVRQTGKDLKKRANLELQGGQVELDRGVLEKMTAPFEHLLRNAIAHGLENESQRAKTNKPTIGEIRLTLRQENNEVVFEISDDGNGLNFEALRQKAIGLGLGKEGEVLNEQQLSQLIFVSGVSTATEVSAVAGRGVGMDVVRSEIAGLGGRIDVSSTVGVGTRFSIHLPLTLAVMQTLMVRSGESNFAIPATMVEQVVQLKTTAMEALHQSRMFETQGNNYPLHYLPTLLGDEQHVIENQPRNSILLLRSSEQRIALHVDELLGRQEAVVKNIGPQLSRLIGVAGATVRGDGAVILILNPVQMAQRVATTIHKAHATEPVVLRTQPLIMVVDDSLTVRKITSRLLLRAGYQVATATDGMNALEQLSEITPDVMLLDVEMPRMDGFELTKNIRRNERMKQFPIIMITSRTADKHRDYAFQLGVNAYLGKPYQEDDLLSRIAAFVEAAAHA